MNAYRSASMSNPTMRVVAVLSLLTVSSPRKLGLVEISNRLNIAKSTCCLILAELCASGHLVQEHGTLRYGIGITSIFAAASLLAQQDRVAALISLLPELYQVFSLPLSVTQSSRRSCHVIATHAPCSDLAKLGLRRPLAAPFGAASIAFCDISVRKEWIATTDRIISGCRAPLDQALQARLASIRQEGYELVFQWEEDELARLAGSTGFPLCDLFEADAHMNVYRRKLLESFVSHGHESIGNASPVNRLVLPLGEAGDQASTCLELWLQGEVYTQERIDWLAGAVWQYLERSFGEHSRGVGYCI